MPEQLRKIVENMQAFGPQRLAMFGGAAALLVALIVTAAIYLNRPSYETLYVGLERSDVNQMGLVLGESGIGFDVASDGTTVLVEAGKTAQARMMLAEKGLPTSTNAGYELFDNVGSLGLTSFMQQVTRVRALEGEIARTIQTLQGVRAARVHIVLPERGNFRREEQKPSASVVIRSTGFDAQRSAAAIRHMVAAAVPGLGSENVTIMDSSGTLLASGDDPANTSLARAMDVEMTVASNVEANIRRALTPYLGLDNFRASVSAKVNTDQRQTQETIFDPNSRVERSVQVVKSADSSNQKTSTTPATVQQNLPAQGANGAGGGPESTENSERREETTNFEINSKRIDTVSNGYDVSKLSIAVVVNEARLAAIIGEGATPEQIAAKVAEIQALVSSAAGFNVQRGDMVNVSSVKFVDEFAGDGMASSLMDGVKPYIGTIINAAAFIAVALLVIFLGLRPLTGALRGDKGADALADGGFPALPEPGDMPMALPGMAGMGMDGMPTFPGMDGMGFGGTPGLHMEPLGEFEQRIKPAPQERLSRMVDLNEERTALILRKWVAQEAA